MNKEKLTFFERYLAEEISIEFKACLYFFCILFYYSIYRLAVGRTEASIIHMAEMIVMTYGMGYAQVYLLSNFDEVDSLKVKEIFYICICSLLYTGVSFLGKWFDGNMGVTVGFLFYMMFAYVCAFLIYKFKRNVDEKILNDDLKCFKEREDR